ncbi:precorrin-6y C5,15-methyltransferase (decarboxylating) subunit CbiE [Varunaivibrio sulfuroxidans]|uniref:Precorrin-6Y C5,15-methyltransferase (Decarboxylating) n=1 Tax=Varunaivibrio sulfuroxidans TaxID=1773489 RepID=A0A4R3JGT3_9PROT|nr:precorrin-6y C5,15-methyltransferase (decarboxylating) subunit CbiE [Varunaivibrio sulfuroxidans]TCS65154.1 precorrin-6Y C5,15-methyltransferase (decarboxylating) [Varunaivibrio sulfuroxidans]WES29563.1 precorrin-6y C5,15-methyltransferase (decarboxylating) subunit CbiE [Varunaivibrio sulfuroxidans]
MIKAWLHVIGIGEDGFEGLGAAALEDVRHAEVLVGGARHLEKVPAELSVERVSWGKNFAATAARLEDYRGKRVVVLASGDPLDYGAGSLLIRHFGADAVSVVPAPGSISLACARMGWSRPDVQVVTVHGRALENLNRYLTPGGRLVVLARDGDTPKEIAGLLCARGFGPSALTVLEHLGGGDEARLDGVAETWSHRRARDLNVVAIECRAGPSGEYFSRVPGLPDAAFESDGQLTKREVRAVAMALLGPLPGETMWDVGAGSGSLAIEWMRQGQSQGQSLSAVAVECDPTRCDMIRANAVRLGTPRLKIELGRAPFVLDELNGAPDAVFVGGGVSHDGVLAACWSRLRPGGRLVASAVTLAGEAALTTFQNAHGGELVRLGVERATPVGPDGPLAFQPKRTVALYKGVKS